MKISEIKAGYLLDFGKDGKGIVNYNNLGQLAVSTGDVWMNIEDLLDHFKRIDVYGRTYNAYMHSAETHDREFLGILGGLPSGEGDVVEVVSETSSITRRSVFKPGYIGTITEVDSASECLLLDDKDKGWVALEDLRLFHNC